MKLGLAVIILGVALVSCNRKSEPANMAIANKAAEPATSVSGNAVAAAQPTTIPAQFYGRWGLSTADCTSTLGDAKGLLTIDRSGLKFYESKGTLDSVLGATASSFDARYGFAGEGQKWMRTERFTLAGGALQRRTDAEPGQEPPVNLTYRHC